jgi:pyruvate,orthophosphate dikinase
MTHRRWVKFFSEGSARERDLLGGKGANLAEMVGLGLPVPPGFTATVEACRAYLRSGGAIPAGLWDEVAEGVAGIERQTEREFGNPERPLLVSVRSGAAISMPGMMDTVLNVGLNEATVEGLARLTSERFALDSYRRLIQMFGKVVLDVDGEVFEDILEHAKRAAGVTSDQRLDAEALRGVIACFRNALAEREVIFPDDPWEQLHQTAEAVFRSWNTPRAKAYRKANHIPDDLGTAVNVQAMVFGNMGDDCATGVAFSRNPNTGERAIFGEYLVNAQGEDVVAGVRTPSHMDDMLADPAWRPVYRQFVEVANRLERHYRDMQDIEFTVERGKLWMLQTRTGKRTAAAAVRIAVELVNEGLIDRETAVRRIEPSHIELLLHPRVAEDADLEVIATGLPASPGAASGAVVLDPDEARLRGEQGERVILVRTETAADDFPGMARSQGVLTVRGGMTSHAAVVARGMGLPAVTGCGAIEVELAENRFHVGDIVVNEGEVITIDGSTGRVILGQAPTIQPALDGDIQTLLAWADDFRTLAIRANADTPDDVARARDFGAEGVGLCRSEHMFFGPERIAAMRQMILSTNERERACALRKLERFQEEDYRGIFEAMPGMPVVVRLLDPPLHEFLPHDPEEQARLAEQMSLPVEEIQARIGALREANPMLGLRGCRLGITHPEITRMQARALLLAALSCAQRGIETELEIMVPLVGDPEELRLQRVVIDETARDLFAEAGGSVRYRVGTMIELPRAALLAGKIAAHADFFSFGTNDLTQTTLGLSRDDAGRFLPNYVEDGIYKNDPFQSLDREGVGQLVEIGVERGRRVKPGLSIGICGEHGGDPASVEFFNELGVDYVSCSPFRVPVARLAAARAALADHRVRVIEPVLSSQ